MKKSNIERFIELYHTSKELEQIIDLMIKNIDLNQINCLTGILRKLLCKANHTPLLLDLLEEEKYPIFVYAIFDDSEIKSIHSYPFGNGSSPGISLNKFDFSQQINIGEWINKTQLIIDTKIYTAEDIILQFAHNQGVHSDEKYDKLLQKLEEVKISNEYFTDMPRYKLFIYNIGRVLSVKINEFIGYYKIKYNGNEELKEFYQHYIENISKKIDKNPNNLDFYYERAITFCRLDKINKSLQDIEKVLKIENNSEKGLYQKAILLHNKKDYKGAIEIYNTLTSNGYGEPGIYNNIGNVYLDNGEYDLALESYYKALEICNTYNISLYGLGKTYRLLGNFDKSIEILEENNLIGNLSPLIEEELGLAYIGKGEYEKAITFFEKAITIKPGNKFYYLQKGDCLSAFNKQKKAIKEYDKAIEIDNDYLVAHFNKGNSQKDYAIYHLKYGRKEKASEYFNKALESYIKVYEIDNSYELLHSNKSYVLTMLGKHKEALEIIDLGIDRHPNKTNNYINKLILLKNLKQTEEFGQFKTHILGKFKGQNEKITEIKKYL